MAIKEERVGEGALSSQCVMRTAYVATRIVPKPSNITIRRTLHSLDRNVSMKVLGAMSAAGVTELTVTSLEPFRAEGLRSAMLVIPALEILLAAVLLAASRTIRNK